MCITADTVHRHRQGDTRSTLRASVRLRHVSCCTISCIFMFLQYTYCSTCHIIAHRSVLVFQAGPTITRWQHHVPFSPVSVAHDDASLRRTCKLCGKTLTTELGLKYHVAMHEGQYRYHCQFCGRGFSSTTNLKGHLVQHTGIKAFLCHICKEEFTYGYMLKRHMQKYHADAASASQQPQ